MKDFRRHAADIAAYNAAADRIMKGAAVPMIDLHQFTLPFLPEGYLDNVHFVERVRELHAAFIAGCLSQIIAEPNRPAGQVPTAATRKSTP